MSEKQTPQKEVPNYRRRRAVAVGLASLAITIPVIAKGKAESIPVRLGDVIENANAPHGRAIAKHPVSIENSNGIKGSRIVVEQGNEGFTDVKTPKPYTVKIENADGHYGGVKYEQWGGQAHGVGEPIRVDVDSSGKEHLTTPK